jgi:uncharacterized protein YjiK
MSMALIQPGFSRALLITLILTAGFGASACADPGGKSGEQTTTQKASGKEIEDAAISIAGRRYQLRNAMQFSLPEALREISGLTLDDEARLYAHDDERAIIYQIDYAAGRILKRFALEGSLRGDFEGIAWLDGMLYMTTSRGVLHEFPVGAADSIVPYRLVTDALNCEVEGLSRLARASALIAACKNRPKGKKALHFHHWRPGAAAWSEKPALRLKRSEFDASFARLAVDRPEKFQPTAITSTPEGHLLVISGPQKVLLEFTADGTPVAAARIDPDRHRQPEGIAMTANGTILIADEGDNKGASRSAARLSIYRPDPTSGERQ